MRSTPQSPADEAREDFHVWLEERDARTAAKALRDAARDMPGAWYAHMPVGLVQSWLRQRADRVQAGEPT